MNKNQTLLESTRPLRPCLIQSVWSYFSAPSYTKRFFADGIIRWLLYDYFLWPHIHIVTHIYGLFFVRIYMRVCKKMVIYLGIKTLQRRKERKYTWQKTHVYRVAGMIASIRVHWRMVLISHTLLRTLYPFKLLETRTVKKIAISHKYRTLFRRVRGWISGWSLPVQIFFEYLSGISDGASPYRPS